MSLERKMKRAKRFDALLLSLDPNEAMALYNEHCGHLGPPKNEAHIAALHKARIARVDLINESGRELSRVWLVTHGYNVDIGAAPLPFNLNDAVITKH